MGPRVVVIGAGIAGVAIAHSLTVDHGFESVTLIDPRPPLTLTSDKSTECYRNWWPGRSMVGLMNRSIDILERLADESENAFGLTRRGYLFVTADPATLAEWERQADLTSEQGGGPVRRHPGPVSYRPPQPHGFHDQPEGVDIFEGDSAIREFYPYLTDRAVGALHVRRAGWFSAQQLGSLMIRVSLDLGLHHIKESVVGIETDSGSIRAVNLSGGRKIPCDVVVNAAGPMAREVAAMAGIELPLSSEVHLKVAYRDHRNIVPRDAPMVIWSDPQRLDWSDDEREALAEAGRPDLLDEMPVYCHGRPEGGTDSPYFLALWEYHNDARSPEWPLPEDTLYPEVVMRGLTTMIPAFDTYLDGLPPSTVDGGYYIKTPENRPLIGPAGPAGFQLACGYSGFGVMVACGAADLVASHVSGSALPEYAPDFLLSRYDVPGYLESIGSGAPSGQL
jgi:sarcosine oxidase, subunit beta